MGRDQGDNAVRAARHGAALRLRPSASPGRIAAAVRRLLAEPSFREGARRLGEQLRRDADGSTLVAEIEAVAGRSRDRSAPAP
jgi:UDP:flavonoid glycosyltransferase YjiC (YdhE family)